MYGKYINDSDNSEELKLALENYTKFYSLDKNDQKKVFENNTKILKLIDLFLDQIVICLEKNFPEVDSSKEVVIKRFDNYLSEIFPDVEGDKVIQIGTTVKVW